VGVVHEVGCGAVVAWWSGLEQVIGERKGLVDVFCGLREGEVREVLCIERGWFLIHGDG